METTAKTLAYYSDTDGCMIDTAPDPGWSRQNADSKVRKRLEGDFPDSKIEAVDCGSIYDGQRWFYRTEFIIEAD